MEFGKGKDDEQRACSEQGSAARAFTDHCPLFTVPCPLFTVHCPLSIVHCSLFPVPCPLFTAHCPLESPPTPLFIHSYIFNPCRLFVTLLKSIPVENILTQNIPHHEIQPRKIAGKCRFLPDKFVFVKKTSPKHHFGDVSLFHCFTISRFLFSKSC